MGYYSDVMVSTTQDGFEFLKRATEALAPDEEHPVIGGWLGYEKRVNDDDGVVFGWSCVKWYREFPEVNAFMNALALADEAGIPLEYAEVGEDGVSDCWESDTAADVLTHHIEVRTSVNIY